MRICPHCNIEFLGTGRQFGAHIRNCKMNPKLSEMNKNFKRKSHKEKYTLNCAFCGNKYDVYLTKGIFKAGRYKKNCSPECSHKIIKKFCLECGKEVLHGSFCNKDCKSLFQYKSYIIKWKSGLVSGMDGRFGISKYIRRYFYEKYDNRCCKCGWSVIHKKTGKIPLTIHHKDGNYKNNNEENIDLLCPNCHSLTENYCSLNMGNGRNKNKKR